MDAIKMCGVSLSPLLVLEKYYKKITQKENKISLKITEKDCWRILGKRVQNKRKKTCQNQEKNNPSGAVESERNVVGVVGVGSCSVHYFRYVHW